MSNIKGVDQMKVLEKIVFDSKVSDRKLLIIPTETIAATPYNPKSRTKESAKLLRLAESIKKYGLILPIVITSDRDLVDGNRRLAAAKIAGLKEIECVILPPEVDRDEVFCDVNTTAEKIGGKGWLEACRYGYKKAPAETYSKYQELLKLVGTYGIDMLIEKKIGLNILDLCKSVKSCGIGLRLDQIVMQVAEKKMTNKVNAIIRSGNGADIKREMLAELFA